MAAQIGLGVERGWLGWLAGKEEDGISTGKGDMLDIRLCCSILTFFWGGRDTWSNGNNENVISQKKREGEEKLE